MTNLNMNINISLPLKITRQWLYVITVLFSIFFILLPISILSYINFYNLLIPDAITTIPLKFHSRTSSAHAEVRLYNYKFDPSIKFRLAFDIGILCNESNRNKIVEVPFTIAGAGIRVKDSLILNCEPENLFSLNNRFIPYNLRLWVSPILVKLNKVHRSSIVVDKVSGNSLNFMDISLEKRLMIDDSSSFLNVIVEWDGFRYYLINYYMASFVIGVGIFWGTSSFICLVTSFIIWSKISAKKKTKDFKID